MSRSGAKPPDPCSAAERFVPAEHGPIPAYEHAHRYALAAPACSGRRVLDLASGSGYGSRILRAAGAEVVALDLGREAAAGAAPAVCARAEQLPFDDDSFEVVVCFEAIEHVERPGAVLAEIVRVLDDTGCALLSTPDRAIYTERAGNRNPYHTAEMSRTEFAALLARFFPQVVLYGQSVWAGSWVARLDAEGAPPKRSDRRVRVVADPLAPEAPDRESAPWVDATEACLPTPLYVLAACAREESGARRLARKLSSESLLQDPAQWLVGHYLRALEGVVSRDAQIAGFADHARHLEQLVAEEHERAARHDGELEQIVADREAQITALRTHAGNLEEVLRERDALLQGVQVHGQNLERLLAEREEQCTGLRSHVQNLERLLAEREEQCTGLRSHVENLERLLAQGGERVSGLEAHVRNLEGLVAGKRTELDGVRSHVENLAALLSEREEQISGLGEHARNLEGLVSERNEHLEGLRAHVSNLESQLSGMGAHAANLESQLSGVGAHAANLESQLSGVEAHARNLEVLVAREDERLQQLGGRIEELEGSRRELERIRSSIWFRLLHRLGLVS